MTKVAADSVLNEEIISAQGAIFFLAGYETTSNALSTCLYNLAKHPEIQERVRTEIVGLNGPIDFDVLHGMKYLDAVVKENLRKHPSILFHCRQCTEDCSLQVGDRSMLVKKGVRINMMIPPAHYNPDFFPQPEDFRPERFLEGDLSRFDGIYRPFGGGSRHCIGRHFALTEIKMALTKILTKYRLVEAPETTLELLPGGTFVNKFREFKVKFESL